MAFTTVGCSPTHKPDTNGKTAKVGKARNASKTDEGDKIGELYTSLY